VPSGTLSIFVSTEDLLHVCLHFGWWSPIFTHQVIYYTYLRPRTSL